MIKVILDGNTFTDSIGGIDNLTATIRRKDTQGSAALSYAGELTFWGDAYQVIKDKLICTDAPHLARIPIQIFSEFCTDAAGTPELLFSGFIEGQNVDWCEVSSNEPCSAKAPITDASQDATAVACLKNTIIWDRKPKADGSGLSGGEDSFRPGRYITYCNDMRPRALQEGLMLMGLMLKIVFVPVLFVVALIVTVINAIITAINVLPGVNIPKIDFDGNDDTSVFDEFKNLVEQINDNLVGCGRKHKAPFLHSYMNNLCEVCGLTLQSQIFSPGGVFHNLTRLDAAQYEGKRQDSNIEQAYNDNKPNLNGLQFLETLRDLGFDWEVRNGMLKIDPQGDLPGDVWFDQNAGDVTVTSFCINPTKETVPAYGVYEYSKDGIDGCGDEVRSKWGDVIDWNTPPKPAQAGAKQVTLLYGAAHFRQDNQSDETIPIDKVDESIAYPNLKKFHNVLILQRGTAINPKLLLWDGTSPAKDARVWRRKVGDKWDYNVPIWLREKYNLDTTIETLYSRVFDRIHNPRRSDIRLRPFEMDICITCDLLKKINTAKYVKVSICGLEKVGEIEEIDVNFSKLTAKIKGKV